MKPQAIQLTRLAWLMLLLGCQQDVQCREADVEGNLAALTNGSDEALYLKLESWEEAAVVRISAIGRGQEVRECEVSSIR